MPATFPVPTDVRVIVHEHAYSDPWARKFLPYHIPSPNMMDEVMEPDPSTLLPVAHFFCETRKEYQS
jgi:hypothetical protein